MTDYLFGSARIRALESTLIGHERMNAILLAPSEAAAYERLEQCGVALCRDDDGTVQREPTVLSMLKRAYQAVEDAVPNDALLSFWKFPYDCNNVKVAIKAFDRKVDPRPMMFDFGTVDADAVVEMVACRQPNALPTEMRKATTEAMAVYAKTNNPQWIDLLLDRACYADMLHAACEGDNACILRLLRAKIDLLNLMMTVRVLRMRESNAATLLEGSLIARGMLPNSFWSAMFSSGESELWQQWAKTAYGQTAFFCDGTVQALSALERAADNCWMSMIRETRLTPIGAEVIVAFLLAHEYEVKNLRIVLAGKASGLSVDTIRERMRDSYV